MTVKLNHIIVWCHDNKLSARFVADVLGRPPPRAFGHFMVVDLANEVSLDFMEKQGEISLQHYAFLVSEGEFDDIFERIQYRRLEYWADPGRTKPGEINHHFGGRGVYFKDLNGHLLEAITQPYGNEA